MSISSNTNREEFGQTLVLFALMLAAMLMVVALVADIGMMMVERRRIQNAADAAALAGARALPGDPELAVSEATSYASANGVDDDEILSVKVVSTHTANDTVEIKLKRDVPFTFARVSGILGDVVSVRAAAVTGGITGVSNLAPFGVEQSVFEGLGQGDTTTLKYNATSGEGGNFLPLVLDKTGSDEYGENIIEGSDQLLCSAGHATETCVSEVSTQPGNVVGKTKSSLKWAFDHTSDSCDTYSEVLQPDPHDEGRWSIAGECNRFNSPSAQSYQLIIVPVITDLCNGSCDVTVLEFALFFMEGYQCGGGGQGNSCDLIGRYAMASGSVSGIVGAYDPEGSVKSVRLIE